jgi:hypothetical protein
MDTARVSSPPPTRLRTPFPVVAWRAVIAGFAWWGLLAALHGDLTQLRYFSQVTTLTVALTASASVLGFAVRSTRWGRALAWCRGASTTYAIVTAVIYQVLLSGTLDATSSLLEHAVVPALAVIDWVAFGSGRVRQLWWTSLSWLILPIGYLAVYYNLRDSSGEPLYPFLDPGAANFWTWVGIMIGVFIAVGAVVWSVGLLRSAGRRSAAAAAAPMPDR